MLNETCNIELDGQLNFRNVLAMKSGFDDKTKKFIAENLKIRTCTKYKESKKKKGYCFCNREQIEHRYASNSPENWTYTNNTELSPCDKFGLLNFQFYNNVPRGYYPKFIRFDCMENCEFTCKQVYKLMTEFWNIPSPKLIISINGGLKKMNFISNQHKRNFKQGLVEVMKKDQTWVIGSGFNVGIHRLVSETIYEFRLQQDAYKDQISLIGISTWGSVKNNDKLQATNKKGNTKLVYRYENVVNVEKGKVTLDALYDNFLFCDDGTEKQYDKEVEFRLKFENYIKTKAEGFLVQILFEGGRRALINAHRALSDKIPLVVIKGSGRVANIISEVMELPKKNVKENIDFIVKENKETLQIAKDEKEEGELVTFTNYLYDMYDSFKKKIVIYDMMDTTMKFDKKILQAMILGADKSLEKTLKLCIRFNCPNIAEKFVFSDPEYGELDSIEEMFSSSLIENKPEFVNLFIENNFDVDKFVSKDILKQLYEVSFNPEKCSCAELLSDLIGETKTCFLTKRRNTNIEQNRLVDAGGIIVKLSGNVLNNRYYESNSNQTDPKVKDGQLDDDESTQLDEDFSLDEYNAQDVFLWTLLSGRTDLSLIFWRISKNHIGSALIAAIILQNMSNLVLIRGDNNLQRKLMDASKKYQDLALSIITEAYNNSKSKTYTLLIRSLKTWNNLTCLQIAVNGNMLEFLNHSACRSYTTKIWMGDLSPFIPTWKIIITIPFSVFLMKPVIMPSFPQKGKLFKDVVDRANFQNKRLIKSNSEIKSKQPQNISFFKAMHIFYRAPIVKFYINLFSYFVFLMFFMYCNLVELKPIQQIKSAKEMFAEIYVYIYVITFTIEEIRQILDQELTSITYKFQEYFSRIWNKLDLIIIIFFISSTLTRFTIPSEQFMLCRCLFAMTLSMFFLRSMQFYFVNKSIGPKVIMIRDMLRDILFFLSIFVIFILAYGTLSHSLRFPNSKFELALFKDIAYIPYFQTYGELMLDQFEISGPCNGTDCLVKNGTVIISFAVFLLLTNVLLINLLIAMFGYTFNQIQDDSEKLWSFIRIQLVQEFYEKPMFPPPINILYYIFRILSLPCFTRCPHILFEQENNLILKTCNEDENIKLSCFEQFCMESTMIESNDSKLKETSKSNTEFGNITELFDKLNVKPEISIPTATTETAASFQIRLNRRLDNIEKQLEHRK